MSEPYRLNIEPPEDWQAERLARWLLEWELMQAPAEDVEEGVEQKAEALPDDCTAPPDEDFEPGQIRLLLPQGLDSEMVFIAIASVSDGECTCVPFGPFAEPATPDELLSGREEPPVRVFCLWNVRTIPVDALPDSWVTDQLSDADLTRLLDALLTCRCTGQVSTSMERDAGPPLSHPEDPRREYRYQETHRIDKALVREGSGRGTVIEYRIPTNAQALPKAAEDHDEYEV